MGCYTLGFYDALGAGKSFEFAYNYGCTSISMAGIQEELTPIIKRQCDLDLSVELEIVDTIINNDNTRAVETIIEHPDSLTESTIFPPSLDSPEGSVSLDSSLYIERPPIELDCYETILKTGALIRIKAPRQMGKTSLMQRILNSAKEHQHETAYLNFQEFDHDSLNSLDLFLQGFCANVANALELEDQLTDLWKGGLGSKTKCSNYFQRYLLKTISEPLTLGLDEVDQVFQCPEVAQEFFGLLRTWHEKGKNDHLRRLLSNLNQNNGELANAMKKVVASDNPVRLEGNLGFNLRSMGLVKFRGNDVIPLCNLYRLYFSDHLGVLL